MIIEAKTGVRPCVVIHSTTTYHLVLECIIDSDDLDLSFLFFVRLKVLVTNEGIVNIWDRGPTYHVVAEGKNLVLFFFFTDGFGKWLKSAKTFRKRGGRYIRTYLT